MLLEAVAPITASSPPNASTRANVRDSASRRATFYIVDGFRLPPDARRVVILWPDVYADWPSGLPARLLIATDAASPRADEVFSERDRDAILITLMP